MGSHQLWKGTWAVLGVQYIAERAYARAIEGAYDTFHPPLRMRSGNNMKKVSLYTFLGIAATLTLAVQPVASQDRSEEYEQGYSDAMCDMFRELAPLLLMVAPMAVANDPEVSMADFFSRAEECGVDWAETASQATTAPTPEPADPARCERLAALIDPLDTEIDRLLASSTDSGTSLAITQAQSRRRDIEREMDRAGC